MLRKKTNMESLLHRSNFSLTESYQNACEYRRIGHYFLSQRKSHLINSTE